MSGIYDFITTNWAYIAVIIGWAATFYKFFDQKKTNQKIQDKQNTFNEHLSNITENIKFENQRRLADYNLYATKKNQRYVDLYEKLCMASNNVFFLSQKFKIRPEFSKYNEGDMIKFLNKYPLTEKTIYQLLNEWKNDNKKGIQDIYDMISDTAYFNAEKTLADAKRSYLQANLYLPEIFSKTVSKFIEDLNTLAVYTQIPCYDRKNKLGFSAEYLSQLNKKRSELKDTLSSQFTSITINMRKSLLDNTYDTNDSNL